MYFNRKENMDTYNAYNARKAVEVYKEEVAAKALEHALESELFWSVTEDIKKAAYHVVHTAHAGYKPKNMPSMSNGGWVYDVDTMTIGW